MRLRLTGAGADFCSGADLSALRKISEGDVSVNFDDARSLLELYALTESLRTGGTPRTVDNFVGQLRKRFEVNPEQPRHFVTVRGSGYRFDP